MNYTLEILGAFSNVIVFLFILIYGVSALFIFVAETRTIGPKASILRIIQDRYLRSAKKIRLVLAFGYTLSFVSMIASSAALRGDIFKWKNFLSLEITVALLVLMFTVFCIIFAIKYAPKKLFITTGAALAFILAAFLYEGAVAAINLIEQISKNGINISSQK